MSQKLFLLLILIGFTSSLLAQNFSRTELPIELNRPWEISVDDKDQLWVTQAEGIVTVINPETGTGTNVYVAEDYFGGSPSEDLPYCFNPKIGAGTLGLTLHPDFSNPETAYVYFMYSYNGGSEMVPNTKFKIKRLKWNAETKELVGEEDIIKEIPSSYDHLGGRLLAVKRNGVSHLYVSIGDHGLSEENSVDCYPEQMNNPNNWAQDPTKMNGKIHRFNMDGSIPADNPILGNSFYTRGHRNPQGLMYDPVLDQLFNIEHGDRTDDEINRLEKGMNYGWKEVRGYHDDKQPGEKNYIENYVAHPKIKGDHLVEAFYAWCDTVPNPDPTNTSWCTVAPSDGIYYCGNAIPEFENSLLVVTLKSAGSLKKEVYQFKLQSNGELMPSTLDNPNPKRFFGLDEDINGRLRDIAISNDGKKIYLINNGGAPTSKVTVYTYTGTSSGPSELIGQCVNVYPNPATMTIRIGGTKNLESIERIEIVSALGKMVKNVATNCTSVIVADLIPGYYNVRIAHSDGICIVPFIKV